MRRGWQSLARGGQWQPTDRSGLQQDSFKPDQSNRSQYDQFVSRSRMRIIREATSTSSTSPSRALDETKFDIRVDHNFSASDNIFCALQLRSSQFSRSRRRWPRIVCRSQRLRQQPDHHQPWPQRRDFGNSRFFPEHRQPDHRRLQPNFRLHHFAGYRQLSGRYFPDSWSEPGLQRRATYARPTASAAA